MGCLAEDDGGDGVHEDGPAPVLGSIRDLRACLMAWPVDEVAFAVPAGWASVGPAVHTCLEKGVTARVVLDTPEAWRGRASVEMLDDLPVLSYQTTPPPSAAMVAKRCIDVVGALVGLLACVVAYCTFGRRIRRASGGPVMFRQTRIGQNGRPFTLYKFRTMRMGAETERSALVAANAMQGPLFKVRDDPRVTPVGRMLRARYLDELPQFWNVLRGDMSLVGTRPPTPDEVARYDLRHHARLAWRPGLTGMWQVKGNGAVRSFEDVLRLDREYVENWSLRLDLAILARTVRKVLHAEGW
jgi:exopolysaccharide biosynthesis polyprenyl glycosylphosphotransferase